MGRRATDSAQGAALLLVILYHINDVTIGWGESHWRLWYIYNLAEPVLMPLLFALAGRSAGRVLKMPSRKVSRIRISAYVWIYAVWACIYISYSVALSRLDILQLVRCSESPARCLLLPINPLWFLHHLLIFVTLSYLFCRDGRLLLAAFAAFQAAIYFLGDWYVSRFFTSLTFFTLGFCYFDRISEASLALRHKGFAALLLIYLLVVYAIAKAPSVDVPPLHDALSVAGIICSLYGAKLLTEFASWKFMSYIGQHMLPIYLLHWVVMFPFLIAYDQIFKHLGLSIRERSIAQICGPFLLLFLVTFCSCFVYQHTKTIEGLYAPRRDFVRRFSNALVAIKDRCRLALQA